MRLLISVCNSDVCAGFAANITVCKTIVTFLPGVYIMSKSSGIMKIDSPGKLGPGLNIDQDVIRKQILAAKQVLLVSMYMHDVIYR